MDVSSSFLFYRSTRFTCGRLKLIMDIPYFTVPVSYKHLDVYKRQILTACSWMACITLFSNASIRVLVSIILSTNCVVLSIISCFISSFKFSVSFKLYCFNSFKFSIMFYIILFYSSFGFTLSCFNPSTMAFIIFWSASILKLPGSATSNYLFVILCL